MPRMYWETLRNVHAAVPVSQLFFASPKVWRVFTCDHLGVYIWFGAMDLADILDVSRAGSRVYLPCAVSTSDYRLSDRDPWIVVAEDTGIFLVAARVGGDLT